MDICISWIKKMSVLSH